MIDPDAYLFFLLGAVALVATPGPDFVFVVSQAVGRGSRAGIVAAAGIATGMCVHTIFAVAGLTAILYTSAVAFTILKYVGAAYLVYLGIRTLAGARRLLPARELRELGGDGPRIYRRAVLTNVLNPKAGVTFLAFLPQFIPADATGFPVLLLGATVAAFGITWFTLVGAASGLLRRFLVESERGRAVVGYAAGSILILLGLRLAWLERR